MYQFKELYTLDFSKVNYINEVHQIIKDELDFPDHYGMNWSAFWDCLTDMYGELIHIEIFGLEVIEEKFSGYAEKMVEILRRFKNSYKLFKDKIQIEIIKGDTREILQ